MNSPAVQEALNSVNGYLTEACKNFVWNSVSPDAKLEIFINHIKTEVEAAGVEVDWDSESLPWNKSGIPDPLVRAFLAMRKIDLEWVKSAIHTPLYGNPLISFEIEPSVLVERVYLNFDIPKDLQPPMEEVLGNET